MTVLKAKIGGTFQSVLSGYASNVYVGPDPPADPNIQFWADTDEVLPIVPWIPLPLLTTWTNYGGAVFFDAAYRKVDDYVEVRGLVKNSVSVTAGTSSDIGTIPTGFRPPRYVMLSSITEISNTRYAWRIDVQQDGIIRVYPTATGIPTYTSLDSIRYSVTP